MIIELHAGRLPPSAFREMFSLPDIPFSTTPKRLVTDSREVQRGDLFIALRGKTEGALFVQDAVNRGAAAVITYHKQALTVPCLVTPNTEKLLGIWANNVLKAHSCRRIGITGSVGKTTTKNAVAAMLRSHFDVHATEGNFNNTLGLPFTVLSMPNSTEILVAEMGMNHQGEIAALSRILMPQTAVITTIGTAHIGNLGSTQAIAAAKAEILQGLTPNGKLFYAKEETLLYPFFKNDKRCIPVSVPKTLRDIPDIAARTALMYCSYIGTLFLDKKDLKNGLLLAWNSDVRRKINHSYNMTLIDDAYNASPESVSAALSYLCLRAQSRRLFVFGDMLELGEQSASLHQQMGTLCADKVDILFLYGEFAKHTALGAIRAGMPKEHIIFLSGTAEEMAIQIQELMIQDDTVLFKASHAERADLICEKLQELMKKKRE